MLDSFALAQVSRGSTATFTLGKFEGFGNDAVQAKIRSRVPDPELFEDLMVEFVMAAWHETKGHKCLPLEEEGWPDLRIDFESFPLPLFVECKRLHVISEKNLSRVINKASNQLSAAPPESFGVVILDVSAAVGLLPLSEGTPPHPVQRVIGDVKKALSGPKNRSVDRAIVVWDDYLYSRLPGANDAAALRRLFVNVEHELIDHVRPIPPPVATFEGYTGLVSFQQ
jgi:hypothetical protein